MANGHECGPFVPFTAIQITDTLQSMNKNNIIEKTMKTSALVIVLCAVLELTSLAAEKLPGPLFDGLGDLHHPATTESKQAQRYFDQGMRLLFGFNHKEAIRSFRSAAFLDPGCAMAHWGVAYACGPHVN